MPGPLTGTYALTLTAAAECTALPEVARVRRYAAEIYHASDREIVVVLSGADLQPGYEAFWGQVNEDRVSLVVWSKMANDAWLDGEPIIDRLSADEMVTVSGATDWFGPPFVGAPLPFNGTIAYCTAAMPPAGPWWAATCPAPIGCRSDHHAIALTHR